MRPALAIVVVVGILGLVQGYLWFESTLPAPQAVQLVEETAAGRFSLRLAITFTAEADAFALEPASVRVLFRGRELLRTAERVEAGRELVIEEVPDVAPGANDFFVEVSAGDQSVDALRAVRLQVFRDDRLLAEQTLWSAPGAPVEGTIRVDVPALPTRPDHEHE